MTRRSVILACFLLLGVAAALGAGEPWKEKPYTEWTMKEVCGILTESPWVKTIRVERPWFPGRQLFVWEAPAGCGISPEAPPYGPPQFGESGPRLSVTEFRISWESARTLRAAWRRWRALRGGEKWGEEEEIEAKSLEQEKEEYNLTVEAPDMSLFDGMDEDALAQNAYLLPKKSKQKIAPSRVALTRGPDRRTVYQVVFFFPKTTEAGEPLIAADEKEIEFACQGSNKVTVKTKFQPPKMVTRDGPDF